MDFERALLLLNVIEKALGHPQLRPLVAAASDELNAMVEPSKDEPVEIVPVQGVDTSGYTQRPDAGVVTEDPKPIGRRL